MTSYQDAEISRAVAVIWPFFRFFKFLIFQGRGNRHLGFLKCGNFKGKKAQDGQSQSPCQISRHRPNRCWELAIFLFFKMAAAAILILKNVEILGAGRLKTAKIRHRAKFCADWLNHCRDMAISFFQDGGRRHLGFLKCRNFRGGKVLDGQNASPCQISRHRPNRCWDMAIFLFFKMATAAIFDFQNVEILGVGRLKTAKMRHHAKFRGDRSNRCWDMTIFLFFQDGGHPPSWICDQRIWTTHEELLMVFITVQNLVESTQ